MVDDPHSDGDCEQSGKHKGNVEHRDSDDAGFSSVEQDGRSLSSGILKYVGMEPRCVLVRTGMHIEYLINPIYV